MEEIICTQKTVEHFYHVCTEKAKKKTLCNTSINPQRLHFKALLYWTNGAWFL